MATTYKFIASGEVETLTANIFADQIEIYDGHPLDPCTMYVWFYDDRLGNADSVTEVQAPTRIGAGGNTYDVDLGTVASSGDYWCEIRVGATEDCWFETERRTISIIECVSPQDRTLAATNASATAAVRHPHYETPVFSNEGLSWITLDNLDICDDQVDHVCLSVASYSLTDQVASSNSARRGQVTITTGPLVCFFGIAQDYIPAAPDPVVPDPSPGPFITLSNNGPTTIGDITVTATVGTIGGDGSPYTVEWSDDRGGSQSSGLTYLVGNPGGAFGVGDTVVTATVTDNNGLTASTTTTVTHEQIMLFATQVGGDVITNLGSIVIWNQQPITSDSGTFTVSGGGTFFARLGINQVGFLGGRPGDFSARLTIDGPGAVNQTYDINTTGSQANRVDREIEFNGNGTYTWSYEWTDGISRPVRNNQNIQPTADLFFASQLF